jgi:hypothetical protein
MNTVNKDLLKSARQMIDDLINDDTDSSKKNFHDFLKPKIVARVNPQSQDESSIDDQEDEDFEFETSDDDDDMGDDSDISDDDFSDDDDEDEGK